MMCNSLKNRVYATLVVYKQPKYDYSDVHFKENGRLKLIIVVGTIKSTECVHRCNPTVNGSTPSRTPNQKIATNPPSLLWNTSVSVQKRNFEVLGW